jgi:hypothetical protein
MKLITEAAVGGPLSSSDVQKAKFLPDLPNSQIKMMAKAREAATFDSSLLTEIIYGGFVKLFLNPHHSFHFSRTNPATPILCPSHSL